MNNKDANNGNQSEACIQALFTALCEGNLELMKACIADGVNWEVIGVGTKSKAELCEGYANTIDNTTHREATIQSLITDKDTGHVLVSTLFCYPDKRNLENRISLTFQVKGGQLIPVSYTHLTLPTKLSV